MRNKIKEYNRKNALIQQKTQFYIEARDIAYNDKVLKMQQQIDRLTMQLEDIESNHQRRLNLKQEIANNSFIEEFLTS